jgi:nucleotide-binding universal stress UspA family protein
LHEARRIAENLNAELTLIHVGEKKKEDLDLFDEILKSAGIVKEDIKIIWKKGKTVKVLYDTCKEEKIDLLILGAIQHEAVLNYYLGSVARSISRNPPCSLLLIIDPKMARSKLNSIVVNGHQHLKTKGSLSVAFEFSRKYEANNVFVVEEISPKKVKTKIEDNTTLEFAQKEKENILSSENAKLDLLIKSVPQSEDLVIKKQFVFGKRGYSIGHFAEVKNADLLVLNSPDKKLGFLDRFFPNDLEYILSDLPCNLLIVDKNL